MRFKGRVAIVTGGSKGIGKETVRAFANEGATTCIIDIDEEHLANTVKEFKAQNLNVHAYKADVSNREEVEKTIETIYQDHGSVDILVNNAGIIRDNLIYKMTDEDWDLVMNVHLKGAFNCTRAAQKYMVEQKWGRIINISSTSALGNRGQANYSTAKAGLQGFTKTLAIELGKYGLTVNAVAPGLIETDMTKATAKRLKLDYDEYVRMRVEQIPVRRIGQPKDIAHAILFFADENSSFINGQVLYVAGGPRT